MKHTNPTHEDPMDRLIRLALSEGCTEQEETLFASLDVSGVIFDASYRRQRARIIRRSSSVALSHPTGRTWVRVALLTALLISMGIASMIGVSGMAEKWHGYVDWYERSFSISYDVPEPSAETTASVQGEETSKPAPPTLIEEYRKPTYIPEGAEERLLGKSIGDYCISYYVDDVYVYGYFQTLLDGRNIYFNNENVQIYDVKVNDYDAILIEYEDGFINLIWNDGEYIYEIHTYIKETRDELFKMAESVQ